MIQRPGIDYGLGTFVAAEHHEQIRHHSGLLVVVEFYDLLARELVECHLHH